MPYWEKNSDRTYQTLTYLYLSQKEKKKNSIAYTPYKRSLSSHKPLRLISWLHLSILYAKKTK